MHHEADFCRWLRQARRAADLTQEGLAELVGCAAQTLRAIESGRRRPSREMAARLAEALQIPPAEHGIFLRLARTSPAAPAQAVPHTAAHPPLEETPVGQWSGNPVDAAYRSATDADNDGPRMLPLVLATKLYRPQPDADLVRRPRLFARLDAGLSRPLTLVAAPAGSGKTTLLSTWLAAQEPDGPPPIRVAWLHLDPGDADPVRFLRYLIAALQELAPAVGALTLPLLDVPQVVPVATLLPRLVNELTALPDPSVLVLDDYHVIDSLPVHQALVFLLDHLPPQLHLVIASRTDPPLPLARLRARRKLVELRAADLRFTPDETAAFLTGAMALPLSADDIATLEARTEGWIAGLQLAALSLQERPGGELTSFVTAFAGSHRFVVDYLADEVLAAQPAHVQRFLLTTSILDQLCGPLCDVVLEVPAGASVADDLGRAGDSGTLAEASYSQQMLEYLERSNLFIVPLDDERRWYRYHHLFAQVLRQRLLNSASAEAVAALHRRAAAWLSLHGLVVEAINHALAARDWPRAIALLSAYGRGLMVRGQIHTVRAWLQQLPEGLGSGHPALQLLHATALFFDNQHGAAEQRLQAAEAELGRDGSDPQARSTLGYTALLRATIALFRGDLARREVLARQALALLPATEAPIRAVAQIHGALGSENSGSAGPDQERQFNEAVAAARAADELGNLLFALVSLASFRQRQGRLRLAAATFAEAAGLVPDPVGLQTLPNGANYYFGLGALRYEWNELAEAETLMRGGQEIVRAMRVAEGAVVVRGYLTLARVQMVGGDAPGAWATLEELGEVARQRGFALLLRARAAAGRAQLALLQHDLPAAQAWAEASGLHPDDAPDYLREQEYLTLASVYITSAQGNAESPALRNALALLRRLLTAAEAGGRIDSIIAILVLLALAHQRQSQTAEAIKSLERALQLAAPEGYVRSFVDGGEPIADLLGEMHAQGNGPSSVTTLLAAFPSPTTLPRLAPAVMTAAPLAEPLTEREREVLRLLAAGHSNQAIAERLVLAVGTVKRHINNIFGKLAVHSRLQAVARARDLQLL